MTNRIMRRAITEALGLIFQGIAHLKQALPRRAFTIDGRLVGDIGEVIAALEYEVELDEHRTRGTTPKWLATGLSKSRQRSRTA